VYSQAWQGSRKLRTLEGIGILKMRFKRVLTVILADWDRLSTGQALPQKRIILLRRNSIVDLPLAGSMISRLALP
jgi:hypothetical protein